MFQRRLKIILSCLLLISSVLLCRAVQLQIVQHDKWKALAAESLKRSTLLETTRGRILDRNGNPLAVDIACNDAAVDYRAIIKDPKWMREIARKRLQDNPEKWSDRSHRRENIDTETEQVSEDIDNMWPALANISGKPLAEIEKIRGDIQARVEQRKRAVWYRRYHKAVQAHEAHLAAEKNEPKPWYKWLIGEDQDTAPQPEQFDVTVGEETAKHVVLRDISQQVYNDLFKHLEDYPGLELKPSAHRVYLEPANECAANLLGHLSAVTKEDLEDDPNVGGDELKRYYKNDLIGRTGLEALAEPILRGSMGREERVAGNDTVVERTGAIAGRDVRTTIDIELQQKAMDAFQNGRLFTDQPVELHGAAVVIDVPTGQVLAMVSYPTFDANQFDQDYDKLRNDLLDRPLCNRATQEAFEPGSSIKTVVGSMAITRGYLTPTEGIECTGYLVINGHTYKNFGRCWTMRQFNIGHHQVPSEYPHHGRFGNPDGFLTVSDALERSCNVFFETVADRMGAYDLSRAMHDFGLGERTGVGVEEIAGRIPHENGLRSTTWFAGIGQGAVAATPIQMANVAATLARDGVWVRPTLLMDASDRAEVRTWQDARDGSPAPATAPATSPSATHFAFPKRIEDQVDLQLTPQAIAAVREGMIRVVNSPAGTGTQIKRDDMTVAGKTGSAQAAKLTVPVLDESGHPKLDADGKPERHTYEPGDLPWYQGVGRDNQFLAHAWFIGYAPADHPKIAFAVLVEYGGSGGQVAGGVVRKILDACVQQGYLHPQSSVSAPATPSEP